MADIKQRISLDGADDVATKLKRIGDTGSDAFKKLKQYSGEAGSSLARHAEGLGEHAEGLGSSREAGEALRETLHTLHPVLEQAGIELGNFGAFARLAGAGLVPLGAALAGSVLVGLAKLGEESQKAKSRLKALGAGEDGFEALSKQATQLGTSVENVGPQMERLYAARQRLYAQEKQRNSSVSEFVPGDFKNGEFTKIPNPFFPVPTREDVGKSFNALFSEGRLDSSSGKEISQSVGQFLTDVLGHGAVSQQALDQLRSSLPHSADLVARSVSDRFNPVRRFDNAADLSAFMNRTKQEFNIFPDYRDPQHNLFRNLAQHEPDALSDAQGARGVVEGLEGLEAAASRAAEALGGDHLGLTGAIDSFAHVLDSVAEHADQLLHPRDYVPGGPKFIGPVSPEEQAHYNRPDILDVGKALFTGQADDRFKDSNAIAVAKSLYNGPQGLQKTPAEGLQDMIDAARQPGAIYQQQQPFVEETNRGIFRDTNPEYNWPVAPEQPQPQQQSQDNTQGGVNVAAAIDASGEKQSSVLERVGAAIASAIAGLAQRANPAQTKVEGPVDSLGIRGATGGLATPAGFFFDDGGHVRGPGTATSDSIPAMLSNGEYVVKASSVKKAGLGFMNWLNAGKFAEGGEVFPLGLGQHQIAYDETTGGAIIDGLLHYPGDPILDDPVVKQAIQRSKAAANGGSSRKKHKSDFTGRFGHDDDTDTYVADGGLIGHFAGGGLVGMMQHLVSGGPTLDLADHLASPGSWTSLDLTSKLSGGGSPWDGLPHLGSMDLRSDHGDARVVGRQDVLREISRSANARALVRTGPSPSWRT